MIILDFANLTREQNILLNQVAQEIRKPFNNFISKLYEGRENDIDWLLSSIASRNIYLSPLFMNCCYLALVKKTIESGHMSDTIVVSSKSMKKVLDKYLSKAGYFINVEYSASLAKQIKDKAIPPLRWVWYYIYFFYQYLKLKNKSDKVKKPSQAITIIDTFVLENSFKNGIYHDRYYPGLLKFLNNTERQFVYYLPTFYQIKNYDRVIGEIKKSQEQVLLKEDYLKCTDYLFALLHYKRMLRMSIGHCYFLDFEMTPILKEEIYSCSSNASTVIGILNYRFAKRLKEQGIKVRLLIDWFENQVVDRGINLGFRKYFPEAHVRGYLGGAYLDNNPHLLSTQNEASSKVVPQQIAVMGKGAIENSLEFCQDLDVIVAPAFRYQHVWRERIHYPDPEHFTILVALPIILVDGNDILKLIANVSDKEDLAICRFYIKPHPTNRPDRIKKYFGDSWPECFELVGGDFNDCVEESNLLISNGSSTCLETVAKGIPVIIIGSQSGLTQNPIPRNIEDDIWTLCYTEEELLQAILFYMDRDEEAIKRHEQTGRKIREMFFEPVTREGVRGFLNLED